MRRIQFSGLPPAAVVAALTRDETVFDRFGHLIHLRGCRRAGV